MKIIVTAGNTITPIDRVRCLTNVFTGRTGAAIAMHAYDLGHNVTLVTSQPEVIKKMSPAGLNASKRWAIERYRTFEDLYKTMADQIQNQKPDVVIHCAAVGDYLSGGVYSPAEGTFFDTRESAWHAEGGQKPTMIDRAAGKVKSDLPEMWLRMTRAPKLIDLIRTAWGFTGILVKFKLEVDVTEEELIKTAEASRSHSQADLMVANTLDGASSSAYVIEPGGTFERLERQDLPSRLLTMIEQLAEVRKNG